MVCKKFISFEVFGLIFFFTGSLALLSALCELFPAQLAQPGFVRDCESLCISCDL